MMVITLFISYQRCVRGLATTVGNLKPLKLQSHLPIAAKRRWVRTCSRSPLRRRSDDETWEFIKRQIDQADYYIVVIAGRYGSVGPDGVGYTEMEYDYARSIGK